MSARVESSRATLFMMNLVPARARGFSGYSTARASVSDVTRCVSGTLSPIFRVFSIQECFCSRVSVKVTPNWIALHFVSITSTSAASASSMEYAMPEHVTHSSIPSRSTISFNSLMYCASVSFCVWRRNTIELLDGRREVSADWYGVRFEIRTYDPMTSAIKCSRNREPFTHSHSRDQDPSAGGKWRTMKLAIFGDALYASRLSCMATRLD